MRGWLNKKIFKYLPIWLIGILGASVIAIAGSLTPSASPASTFHTLQEIYDSVAGTFNSSSITASTTGTLIQGLKYVANNLYVASSSSGFYFTPTTRNVGIGTSAPTEVVQIGPTTGRLNVRIGNYPFLGQTGAGLATILANNAKVNTSIDNRVDFLNSNADGVSAIEMLYNAGIAFHTYCCGGKSAGDPFITVASRTFERMRIDGTSGNVGIGATSPEQKLNVGGNIIASASGNVDFILRSSTTNGASNNDDSKFTIRSATSNERLDILNGAGATLLSLASGGVAQFGNTTPAGYSRFGTNTTTHGNFISSPNDLLINGDLEVDGSASLDSYLNVQNGKFVVDAASSIVGVISLNSSYNFNVQGSGRFGTGTDTATIGGPLYLTNAGFSAMSVRDSTNDVESFFSSGISGNDTGNIIGTVTNHGLFLRVNNATKLAIATSGNVGIGVSAGTWTPDAQLDVAGNILASASTPSYIWNDTSAANQGGKFTFQSIGAKLKLFNAQGSSSSPMFTIASQAWVGIGYGVTPQALLDIEVNNGAYGAPTHPSTFGSATIIRIGAGSSATNLDEIGFYNFGETSVFSGALIGTKNETGTGNAGRGLYFATRSIASDTAAVERLTIKGNGNVGINNSAPAFTLDIKGTVSFDPFNVASSSGTSILRITKGGNVGIGSTAPGAKLDLSGTASISGNFGVNSTNFYVNTSTGNVGIGTKNVDAKLEVNGTASISNQFFFTSAGNLGIASSSPQAIFHLAPSLNTGNPVAIIENTNNNGVNGQVLSLRSKGLNNGFIFDVTNAGSKVFAVNGTGAAIGSSSSTFGSKFLVQDGAVTFTQTNATRARVTFPANSSGENAEMDLGNFTNPSAFIVGMANASTTGYIRTTTTGGLQLGVNNGTSMTLLNGGNVGIGTTGPVTLLDLKGIAGNNDIFNVASASGTSILRITKGGNVGIGTTIAPTLLSLKGVAGANDIFDVASSSGTSLFRIAKGGNVGIGTTTTLTTLTIKGTAGRDILDIASSSGANILRVTQNGNVGIGTTTAYAQFTVVPRIPTGPIGSATTQKGPNYPYIQGRYAYVSNQTSNSFQIFDVSVPSSPIFIASASTDTTPLGIYVQGRYAYIVNDNANGTLQIFDISNPKTPVQVGKVFLTTASAAVSIYVQGRYAYVTYGQGLEIFDVSNPLNPKSVKNINTGISTLVGVYVQGRYAYTVDSGSNLLRVYNVSDPANAYVVSTKGSLTYPYSVVVQGRYAYIGEYTGQRLVVVDISNPASPSAVGSLNVGSNIYQVQAAGRYVYIARYTGGGFQVIDVSNPASPTSVGIVSNTSNTTGIAVYGRYVYITNQAGGADKTLQIFDMGGEYIQHQEVGTSEIGTLTTRTNANIGNDLNIGGGLLVGHGAQINGPFGLYGSSSGVFMIDTNGQVRIGSTSANATLTVKGAAGSTDLLDIASSSNTSLFRFTKSGNLGIGTTAPKARLSILDNTITTGSIASISANGLTGGGAVFSIVVPASTSSSNIQILRVTDKNGLVIASMSNSGRLALRNSILSHGSASNCTGINAGTVGCIDYAETYDSSDPTLEAGDLVAPDPIQAGHVVKADKDHESLGIVSTNPGVLLTGTQVLAGAETVHHPVGTVPIALSGRVPVKVSLENGPIQPGDRLTLSKTIPGLAMKATQAGQTIGIALEGITLSSPDATILVFVNNTYWPGDIQTINNLVASQSQQFTLTPSLATQIFNSIIDAFKNTLNIVFENGLIQTVKGLFENVETKNLNVENGITTKDTATGQDYCLVVTNGLPVTRPGKCNEQIAPTPSSSYSSGSPASTPSTTASASATPEITPTPSLSGDSSGSTVTPSPSTTTSADASGSPASTPSPSVTP